MNVVLMIIIIVTLVSLTMAVLALIHHGLHPVKVRASTVSAVINTAIPLSML